MDLLSFVWKCDYWRVSWGPCPLLGLIHLRFSLDQQLCAFYISKIKIAGRNHIRKETFWLIVQVYLTAEKIS